MSKMANDVGKFLNSQLDRVKNHYIDGLEDYIKKYDPSVDITKTGDTLSIAYDVMQRNAEPGGHIIDLKQYFAMSSKRKHRKNGQGWYVEVPIRIKSDIGRKAYGSTAWKQISSMPFGMNMNPGVDPAKVQKVLGKSQEGVIPELRYAWKSANVTRRQWGNSGKRGQYFAIRTVSDKSPANSWIVNRQGFSQSDQGKELAPYISAILKRQLQKYNKIGGNF